MGVLPRGVEPHHIGGNLMLEDFIESRGPARGAFDNTSRLLVMCRADDMMQNSSLADLLQLLSHVTAKVYPIL